MRCPKCSAPNAPDATECDGCGVVFAHVNRDKKSLQQPSSTMCTWSDFGRSCLCTGLVKIEGRWLCREHWDVHSDREPAGQGNYPVQPLPRSHDMRKWDGWTYNPAKQRLERNVEIDVTPTREPGADDDLGEQLPEEATQT